MRITPLARPQTLAAVRPPTPTVDAAPAAVSAPPKPRNERLRALSEAHRNQLERLKTADLEPAALQAMTAELLAWDAQQHADPANAELREFTGFWLDGDATRWLAARPLPDPAAQVARYGELLAAHTQAPDATTRALLAAAARGLAADQKRPPVSADDATVRLALAPALMHLAASADPVARELAAQIQAGKIPLQVTNGQAALGPQYYAVVALRGISVSNGAKGPDFFSLSPLYQAAVVRHEYEHVRQRGGLGLLRVMGSNLAQKLAALVARLPGVDEAAWERRAHRWNRTEQEAYAVEKAFLVQAGWGQKGLTPADAGMLDGVDTWLADGKA